MNPSLFLELVQKYFQLVVGKITETFNDKKNEQILLHKTMLTEEYSPDLKWGSTKLNHVIVAADVVSLDSSLPLKSRGSMSNATGTVPKLGVKFRKGENDINNINVMQARMTLNDKNGDAEATLVSKIFDDAPKCIKSMDYRKEIMFLQGLSTGQFLVPAEEVGTGVRVTFNYKEENTFHASVSWGSTGYDPIADLREMFDKAEGDSNTIAVVMLSKKYFNLIRSSVSGKKLVADYRGQVIVNEANLSQPGREAMLEALADEFGATFRVVNSTFRIEKPDGTFESIRPWEEANIVAMPSETVGRLVYGTLAEETNPVAGVQYQKSGSHVLLSKYSKNDPLEEFTAAQSLCIPVIDGAESIYVLHADASSSAMSVEHTTLTFTAEGGSQTDDVHYDGDISTLTYTTAADWLQVNRRATTLTVKAAANDAEGAVERTATITVSDGTNSVTITVTQAA